MYRKILGICAALVALGALTVAPSMASASVTIRDTVSGVDTSMATGAKIIADSTGTSVFTGSFGKVECNENVMTGSIAKNNGTEVQATIEAAYFSSNFTTEATKCRSTLGNVTVTVPALTNEKATSHWCIRTVPGADEWELWGNNCGTAVGSGVLTYILDFSGMTCSYKREGTVTGTFTTDANHAHVAGTLKLSGEPEFTTDESSSIFCPATGKLQEFDFDLYTDPDASIVHGDSHSYGSQPTPNPVYFENVS
jgi:hypothetical protein